MFISIVMSIVLTFQLLPPVKARIYIHVQDRMVKYPVVRMGSPTVGLIYEDSYTEQI
jgi:hypothetical protein